jgi:hypothetical protein
MFDCGRRGRDVRERRVEVSHNLARMMNIVGTKPLIAVIAARGWPGPNVEK